MNSAVNTCLANCAKWLYCVLIVWVALATVRIQINARPSPNTSPTEIPPSVLYELTKVKTIEDLLHMLGQSAKLVIPEQGINTPNTAWNHPHDHLEKMEDDDDDDDYDDDDDDADDDDDDDESDFGGNLGKLKPVPAVLTELKEPRTVLTPSQLYDVESLPHCIPRESVIQVPSEASEPHVKYWPGCVTVMRCGGCCNSDLFECQATKSAIVQRKLIQLEYTPHSINNFQYNGIVAKNISQDTNCSCQCKVKPQDCNPTTQIHRNCQCQCKAPVTCPATKQWDPIRCRCSCSASQRERMCPKVKQEWDEESCSCMCRRDIKAKCRAPHRFNHRRCRCERRST